MSDQPGFTLLSTSDTDLLSARASGAEWRLGNPARLDADGIAALAAGVGTAALTMAVGSRGRSSLPPATDTSAAKAAQDGTAGDPASAGT